MNIKDYLSSLAPQEREAFAERLRTSVAYLALLKGGHRRVSHENAPVYVEASGGKLTLDELRPYTQAQQVA
jgi:DNA-binding transcriptional regulator YdaS (Cro superfamily)